jgi:4-amino-4-deoxy-L-arabinose transferase-like glycosyltransferase
MKYLRSRLASRPRARWGERAWVLLIVLLAFTLRMYRLGAQAIWWDESLSVYRATHNIGTILANTILIQNVVTHDLQPPLYFLILHFLVGAFGLSEYALRFLSVFANVATVPLLYALARRWFAVPSSPLPHETGESVGVLAALLGALSSFYVWYAQEARPYALVLFWSLLAVYALTRAFDVGRGPTRTNAANDRTSRGDLRSSAFNLWIIVYIFAAIAALYTNYYAVFLIPFHAALIALLVGRTPRARPFILLPAVPSVAAVFLVPVALQAARENAASGPGYVPFDVILRDLLNSFSVGITVDLAQVLWVDVILLALFVVGLAAFRRAAIFLLAFLAIPLLGLAAASFIRPLYQNSRYFITLSPPFYLGVAAGIVALARRWKLVAAPALGVFLIGAALSLNNWYFDPRFGKDDHRAWAEYLRAHVRPGDFLILDSPHTEELYHYYADDLVPMTTLPILRADHVEAPAQDLAAVRDAYQRHTRVWFLSMHAPFDDPQQRIEKDLREHGVLIDRTDFRGTSTEIALSLFMPRFPTAAASEIQHPLDIAFTGHLRLRGYAAPASIMPGARGTVTLYWQIDEPVGEDYAVSVRLVDATGARVGQWDTIPLGNRAGSSTWQPNGIVADVQDLAIAANTPPGTYQLRVVPYHSATGNALGDVVTLGEIQIERETLTP